MNIMKPVAHFFADRSGAITVDWVALTAAVVVIGIGLVYTVFGPDNTSGISAVVIGLTGELAQAATNIDGYVADQPLPVPLGGS